MPFSDHTPDDLEIFSRRQGLLMQWLSVIAKWTSKGKHFGECVAVSEKQYVRGVEEKLLRGVTKHNRRFTSREWPLWSRYIKATEELEERRKQVAYYEGLWYLQLAKWLNRIINRIKRMFEDEEDEYWMD